jgi:2-oxoglutarate dehydrogenase E2 component (dihydrolipoamide succinyltransferase)
MAVKVQIPEIGESITEVEIGEWQKSEGDWVERDETVVVLESDKASVELPAPAAGTLARIRKGRGDRAEVGEIIAEIDEQRAQGQKEPEGGDARRRKAREKAESGKKREEKAREAEEEGGEEGQADREREEPETGEIDEGGKRTDGAAREKRHEKETRTEPGDEKTSRVMPAARRLLEEHGLGADEVEASGPGGRLLKEDVQRHVRESDEGRGRGGEARRPRASSDVEKKAERPEEVLPMSAIRRRIAERLVEAQHRAALLTTFNEIDMTEVIALRETHGPSFRELHDVKLGFTSFFVKAVIDSLRRIPELNAEIRDGSIAYRDYYDIGIAVGGGRGLVVPVVRNAHRLSFAEIERTVADLARRARDNELELEELQGGTFTISNGGIYGSLLSTPIVNPPQSGILGLHAIQDRPVCVHKEVVVRPMMYVALTYDHRIVDGREAVTFLHRVKDVMERPARLLLEA